MHSALGLLGGHVAGRAEDRAGLRLDEVAGQVLGQPEVGDLRRAEGAGSGRPLGVDRVGRPALARGGQQDVDRLQVAVDDAVLVGVVDGAGQGADQVGGRPRRLRRAVQLAVEAAAVHVLQREVGAAFRLADLVNLDDAGVVQAGHRLRLGLEARPVHLPGQAAREDHLERHRALQAELAGLVDDAHAAPPQFLQQLVAGHVRPRGRGGGRRPGHDQRGAAVRRAPGRRGHAVGGGGARRRAGEGECLHVRGQAADRADGFAPGGLPLVPARAGQGDRHVRTSRSETKKRATPLFCRTHRAGQAGQTTTTRLSRWMTSS